VCGGGGCRDLPLLQWCIGVGAWHVLPPRRVDLADDMWIWLGGGDGSWWLWAIAVDMEGGGGRSRGSSSASNLSYSGKPCPPHLLKLDPAASLRFLHLQAVLALGGGSGGRWVEASCTEASCHGRHQWHHFVFCS
jgi:hypothetical protein